MYLDWLELTISHYPSQNAVACLGACRPGKDSNLESQRHTVAMTL